VIPEHAWSLLAATGGRPRDVVSLLGHVKNSHLEDTIATADKRLLLNVLLDAAPWNETFARYLLPSLLSVEFCAFENNTLSAFGADAPSPALLNADMLANLSDVERGVPAISLRFARSMPYGLPALRLMVNALVTATNFCELDGSGKDFERVWIGLQLLHLLLQHAVRMTVAVKVDAALSHQFTQVAVAPAGGRLVEPNPVFWPIDETFKARDFPLPSTEDAIDVFAPDALPVHRINALFPSPNEKRVHVAAGASIHRKVSLRAPSLAVWHDLWSPTVAPGSLDALPPGWPVEAVVEWKEGTLVYFDKSTNRAVDSLLLVGGSSGNEPPHVYMFQFMALKAAVTLGTKKRSGVSSAVAVAASSATTEKDEEEEEEPTTVHGIVESVWRQLDELFSSAFAAHVLRRSGIDRMSRRCASLRASTMRRSGGA
jgi:hypothetical protein